MGLERALETQRTKLLRLLTVWLAVVVLMSAGPFDLPRWARSFLSDLLIRAEFAAQCLVQVSARLRGEDGWAGAGDLPPPSLCERAPADYLPSTPELIRRMKALRRLLSDLPGRVRRLLCRYRRNDRVMRAALWCGLLGDRRAVSTSPQWIAPGVERPPDTP